jgi:hypothetical protein
MSETQSPTPKRRKFLLDSALSVIGIASLPFLLSGLRIQNNKSILDEPTGPRAPHVAAVDAPGTHNMLVVGRDTVFLSHLPMFKPHDSDSPHRYQVILEAVLAKVGPDPQTTYAKDRKSHPTTRTYTLSPQQFILPHLNSANANPPLSTFRADLFRGHLEKKGERIIEGADVSIRNVIHFRELDSNAPKLTQLEYILFGKGSELFMAHLLTRPPDFDQVISISIKDHALTDDDLRKGLRIVFTRPNTVAGRLLEKQEATGELRPAEGLSSTQKLKVRVGVEHYLEDGELRVPATFETTPAERRARFP